MNPAAAKAHPAIVADAPAYLARQRDKANTPLATKTPDLVQAPAPRAPTFLVGFPRSGTTLLANCLRGHAEIAVMEEIEIVAELAKDFPELLEWSPTNSL